MIDSEGSIMVGISSGEIGCAPVIRGWWDGDEGVRGRQPEQAV